MKKYLSISEKFSSKLKDTSEIMDVNVFDALEEANSFAKDAWYHLTDAEKARHHVCVGVVTEDDLDEFAKDEDSGDIDWSCFTSYSVVPSAFDSDNE